jgi:hypothetical protein
VDRLGAKGKAPWRLPDPWGALACPRARRGRP